MERKLSDSQEIPSQICIRRVQTRDLDHTKNVRAPTIQYRPVCTHFEYWQASSQQYTTGLLYPPIDPPAAMSDPTEASQTKKFGKGQRTIPPPSQKAQKYYPAEDVRQPKKVRGFFCRGQICGSMRNHEVVCRFDGGTAGWERAPETISRALK